MVGSRGNCFLLSNSGLELGFLVSGGCRYGPYSWQRITTKYRPEDVYPGGEIFLLTRFASTNGVVVVRFNVNVPNIFE